MTAVNRIHAFIYRAHSISSCIRVRRPARSPPIHSTDAAGRVLVEILEDSRKATCPRCSNLKRQHGFAAPAYDDVGQAFNAARLNACLAFSRPRRT